MKNYVIVLLFFVGIISTLKSQTNDAVQIQCFQLVFKGEMHDGYVNLIVIGNEIYAGEVLADYNLDCFRNEKTIGNFKELELKSVSNALWLNKLLSEAPDYSLASIFAGFTSTDSVRLKIISFRGKFREIPCDIVKTYPLKAELSCQSVLLYDIDFSTIVVLDSISSDNTFYQLIMRKSDDLIKYANTNQFWQFGGM